jgi:transcriptional regulator with XRE-family HTH domain
MNCNCGAKLKVKPIPLYHYKECGLPNVFLAGIDIAVCAKCGERYPIVPSILELYEKISEAVALKPVILTPREIKFLRKQLGLTAARWATYLKMDKSYVSRIENGHVPISKQFDAFVRFLYFRLLEDQNDEATVPGNIANRIASVELDGEDMSFKFQGNNPSVYAVLPTKELSRHAC